MIVFPECLPPPNLLPLMSIKHATAHATVPQETLSLLQFNALIFRIVLKLNDITKGGTFHQVIPAFCLHIIQQPFDCIDFILH